MYVKGIRRNALRSASSQQRILPKNISLMAFIDLHTMQTYEEDVELKKMRKISMESQSPPSGTSKKSCKHIF